MKRSKKIKILSIIMLLIVISLSVISYAAFTNKIEKNGSIQTNKLDTIFIKGTEFKTKINALAGTNEIKEIKKSSSLSITPTESNIVSIEDSGEKIYAWYSEGVIYYYSEDETLYLNSDSSNMFSDLTNLQSIDLSIIDTSKVTNINDILKNDTSMQVLVTPSNYPSNLEIVLPKTLYDSEGNAYTKLDSTSPTKTTLISSLRITFNSNGGSGSMSDQIISSSSDTITKNTFTKTGYKFVGWNTKSDGTGTAYLDEASVSTITSSVTLYAQWIGETYKVFYNGHGGTQLQKSSLVTRLDGLYNSNNTHTETTNWIDISGNSNNGIIYNGTWGEDYLEFNGTSTWVNLGEINSDHTTLTVTFSVDSVKKHYVIGNWEAGGGGIYITSEGYISSELYINGEYHELISDVKVTPNEKYSVSLTYDGNKICSYINGKLNKSKDIVGTIGAPVKNTVMALGTNPYGYYSGEINFKGKIYNAAIYSEALTEEEIKNEAVKEVTYNENYGTLPTPVRKGYTFAGWYKEESLENKVESTTKVTTASDHNLYAKWTPKTYTVTYDCNGGKNAPTDQTATYNETFTVATDVCTRVGYIFSGWEDPTEDDRWTNFSGTWTYDNGDYGISNNTLKLKAKWTRDYKTYKVTYNANGGKFNNENTTNEMFYDVSQAELTKYSHTSNITDEGIRDGDYANYLATKDVVTLDGADSVHVKLTYATEKYYDRLYIFKGEYKGDVTDNMSQGQLYTYTGGNNSTTTVEFDVEGDTVTFAFYSDEATAYYGYYAEVTGIGIEATTENTYKEPTHTTAVFDGWYTDSNCTDGNEFKIGNLNSDIELFAKWIYIIEFDTNGIQDNPETIKEKVGSNLGELPTLIRRCYEFSGWSTTEDGNNKVTNLTVPTSHLTLYPIWTYDTTTHKVTYNANGGKFTGNVTKNVIDQQCLETKYSHTDNIDDDGTQLTYTVYNYDGSTYTDPVYYGSNSTGNDVVTIDNASNLYVSLKYSSNSYADYIYIFDKKYEGVITKNMTNGQVKTFSGQNYYNYYRYDSNLKDNFIITGNTTTISFYYDPSAHHHYNYGYYAKITALPSNYKTPIYGNRTFDGWYTDSACTEGNEVNFDNITEDIEIYAKWVYNITYTSGTKIRSYSLDGGYYDGEKYIHIEKIKAGESLGSLNPSNVSWMTRTDIYSPDNFYHYGWSKTKNGDTIITENNFDTYVPTSDMTLYPTFGWLIHFYYLGGFLDYYYGALSEFKYVEKGKSIGTLPTPTREGYTFDGWYDNITSYKNDEGTIYVASGNKITSSTIPTGNKNYYAKWIKDEVWAKDLAYFDNGDYLLHCNDVQCALDTINKKISDEDYLENGYYFGDLINNPEESLYATSAFDLYNNYDKHVYLKISGYYKYVCSGSSSCLKEQDYTNVKRLLISYYGKNYCEEHDNYMQCSNNYDQSCTATSTGKVSCTYNYESTNETCVVDPVNNIAKCE